jgi:hypothetical protein
MARKSLTYGTIKVRHQDAREQESLLLTFKSREAYDETHRRLMKATGLKIIDGFWGYQLFDDADEAMHAVSVFCRPPVAAKVVSA